MKRIIHRLELCHEVLVASHENPDGDAVGSLVAMSLALIAVGKNVTLYNPSPIPAVYRFLPAVERIERTLCPPERYDTVIILDCGDLSRIGGRADDLYRVPVMINIDHHVTNTGFGHFQCIDMTACATAEIVYRIIKQMGTPLTREMATAIYTGILTDTGSFRFANTNQAAFAICDEMVSAGVDPYQVAQHVYGAYSLGRIKLLNLALDSLEILGNGEVSVMTLTQEMLRDTGTQMEDSDGMINYAKRIQDVKVAILIQEGKKEKEGIDGPHPFHVSLRSDGSVNVADLAASFGGGGHPQAAGFSIESTLQDVKKGVLSRILQHQPPDPCNRN